MVVVTRSRTMDQDVSGAPDPLAGFSAPVGSWFRDAFAAPTSAQVAAWRALQRDHHALLIAPTGSGKTLAAFLASLDRLATRSPDDVRDVRQRRKVSVLYISPLKALASDVQRNLTAPLRGIQLAAERHDLPSPNVTVGVRSGDTPPAERRRLLEHPPDILITTPESLFLLLSSQAAQTLDEVHTVIVDEIHALAGTKRGVHLQLSLERLDAARNPGFRRIGLSATVSPAERVARFLGGSRPVDVLSPSADKAWDLRVELPVPDLTDLALPPDDGGDQPPNASVWPHLERRVLELVDQHRTTLCFVNSRRVAERLTAHLNEAHAARLGVVADEAQPATRTPAQVMAQSGSSAGVDPSVAPVIARAHHGSVSKERRLEIESDLKSGRLPCVVATSSLELGIDMGSIDLVVQVAAPMSVSSGLQRVGRAGHQVGAVSKGVMLPTNRGDVLETTVVRREMLAGAIEPVHPLRNPLDVLAQQVVSMVTDETMTSAQVREVVRRCDAYRDLPDSAFTGVLDMLSGRYPSEEFAELRPRLVWDRATDQLRARPGARRLVTTSGGTIPDRGLFGVFLRGEPGSPGRRVGELDEEMVHESRVGDVFTLGTTSWRIDEITPHQVIVLPAAGEPGRLPFWKGDAAWRPAPLGRAVGQFVAELCDASDPASLLEGLDEWSRDNLLAHVAEQRRATGEVPRAGTVVVERFTDELGDWRLVVHCALGAAVLTPWALAIEAQARETYGEHLRAWASNDGIVISVPDTTGEPPGLDLVDLDPETLVDQVSAQVQGSALFAARFRECAARALLLPRLDPGRRTPLWQQRQRSAQLLQVAMHHPDFPIVLETMRECLEDVFDLPALVALVRDVGARRTRLVLAETDRPSPFARSLLFGYVGEFLYDGDQPIAERRLAALSVDPALLAELLGRDGEQALLEPAAIEQVEADLQRLSEPTRAMTAEALWDVVRTIGPLTGAECVARAAVDEQAASIWLDDLARARRLVEVRIAGQPMWAVPDDLGLLRDALGVPAPAGFADAEGTDPDDALERLATRALLTRCGTSAGWCAERWGVPVIRAQRALERLGPRLRLVQAEDRWWHPDVLARVRRRSLALLRAEVEPVEPAQLGRFLVEWHEVLDPASGGDGLLGAVDQLAGFPIPASMLESLVLPARVRGYQPHLLDRALSSGEVVWTGAGPIGTRDGWVCLWPADLVWGPDEHQEGLGDVALGLQERLRGGGAWLLRDLVETGAPSPADVDALWELVWAGLVTSDSPQALRDLVHTTRGGTALRQPALARVQRRRMPRLARPIPTASGPPGRWSLVRPTLAAGPQRAVADMGLVLNRHGIVTRGTIQVEPRWPHFSGAYQVLSQLEDQGAVRRGHAVEGLGAAQFALPGAVDRLRTSLSNPEAEPVLLAACDPANPYGAALAWPPSGGHHPSRRAGALVVLTDGVPTLFVERGVRSLLTFDASDEAVAASLDLLADAVGTGRLASITVEKCDGEVVLGHARFGPLLERAGFHMSPQGYRLRAHSRTG